MRQRLFILNEPISPRLSPSLAKEIGLHESILLLQIEFWVSINPYERDGDLWTRQDTKNIARAFPFMSTSTINRALKNLVDLNLLKVTSKYNERRSDKTRWFSIKREGLLNLKSVIVPARDRNQNDLTSNQNDFDIIYSNNSNKTLNNAYEPREYTHVNGAYVGTSDDFFADLENIQEGPKKKDLIDVGPKKDRKIYGDRTIPQSFFSAMHKLCYLAETKAEEGLLGSKQRGRVASVLGHLRNLGANLNRISDFETWWRGTWMSRNGPSGYMPPRPDQVEEYWVQAMKMTDTSYEATAPSNPIVKTQEQYDDIDAIMNVGRNNGAT